MISTTSNSIMSPLQWIWNNFVVKQSLSTHLPFEYVICINFCTKINAQPNVRVHCRFYLLKYLQGEKKEEDISKEWEAFICLLKLLNLIFEGWFNFNYWCLSTLSSIILFMPSRCCIIWLTFKTPLWCLNIRITCKVVANFKNFNKILFYFYIFLSFIVTKMAIYLVLYIQWLMNRHKSFFLYIYSVVRTYTYFLHCAQSFSLI